MLKEINIIKCPTHRNDQSSICTMSTRPKGVPPRNTHVLRELDLIDYHERGGERGGERPRVVGNGATGLPGGGSLQLTKTAKRLLVSVSNSEGSGSKGNMMPVEVQCSFCDGSYPWQASACPNCGGSTSFPT